MSDKIRMAYTGRRQNSKGKTVKWWPVVDDEVERSWGRTVVHHSPQIGGVYDFEGSIVDGRVSITLGSGEYVEQHEKTTDWIAKDRVTQQNERATRMEKTAGGDHELDRAIEVIADRLAALRSGSDKAAWLQWLGQSATQKAFKIQRGG